MTRLIGTVHVAGKMFRPGDEVPEQYARQMGAHCFEGRVHPFPEPASSGQERQSDPKQGSTAPPKAGPGSSKTAWAAYAANNGVTVESDATRDDIIAALTAADVSTE